MSVSDIGTNTLNHLLVSAGIKRVIWIDDLFDHSDRMTDSALAELLGSVRIHDRRLEIPGLGVVANPSAEGCDEVETLAEALRTASEDDYKDWINQIQSHLGTRIDDYTKSSIQQLKDSFGDILQTVGFTQWSSKHQSLEWDHQTLTILDYESKTTTAINGTIVFEQLLQFENRHFQIILLTHNVSSKAEEELKRDEMDPDKTARHRFTVMSKSASNADLEKYIRTKIRTVITHRSCYSLAEIIANVSAESIANTKRQLIDQSINELDRVIFENSLQEGASEVDVLSRIFLLRQRVAVTESISNEPDWQQQLQYLRNLRQLEALDSSAVSTDEVTFRQWRFDEIFDRPKFLNAAYTPVACGDLFRSTVPNSNGPPKRFILLGQPCEMAVRGSGKDLGTRKSEEAFLVEIRSSLSDSQSGEPGLLQSEYFRILDIDNQGYCYLNFRRWYTVNLACLDLAAFNQTGKLELSHDAICPPGLLPGWAKRFKDRREEVERAITQKPVPSAIASALDALATFSLSRELGTSYRIPTNLTGKEKHNRGRVIGIYFPLERIGRLREPLSTAAYTAFASFRTRPAYLHDFSR